MEEQKPHFLLVTFPSQGHINPAIQLANRLLQVGANVTYVIGASGHRFLENVSVPSDMALATFSDGNIDNFKGTDEDILNYLSIFRQRGVQKMEELFQLSAAQGKSVTCLLYTLILPWAPEVARRFHVPSALIWIQPALVFNIYYYYFNGYHNIINDCEKDPSWSLELPNYPFKLEAHDLPSFFLSSNPMPYTFALPSFQEHIEELKKEEKPVILVNTFEALEDHALKAIERFNLISIGPLLPSSLQDKVPSDKDANYTKWLDSQKMHLSVIYVSFGSYSVLPKVQMKELAKGLIQSHRPFLWVSREKPHKLHDKVELSWMEELEQQGLIVPWCNQVEVLSHPSVGCFVTHCGWNSTLESLTYGVPMVTFPLWTDQPTNAKLVEDLWETGMRVKASEGGLVESDEIKRCLDEVMGSEKMRQNAKKWKYLAIEAAKEDGSSNKNLKAFIQELLNVELTKS